MKKDIKSEAYENFLQEFKKLGLLKEKQASVSKPIPKDLDAQILDFCERLRANSFSKYAQEIEQNYLEYKGLSTKLQVLIKKNMGEDKHQPETKIVGLPTVDEAKVLSPAEKQRLTAQKILGKPLSETKSKKEDSLMVMDNTNKSGEPQLVSNAIFNAIVPVALYKVYPYIRSFISSDSTGLQTLADKIQNIANESMIQENVDRSVLSKIISTTQQCAKEVKYLQELMKSLKGDRSLLTKSKSVFYAFFNAKNALVLKIEASRKISTLSNESDYYKERLNNYFDTLLFLIKKFDDNLNGKIELLKSIVENVDEIKEYEGAGQTPVNNQTKSNQIQENVPGANKDQINGLMDQLTASYQKAQARLNQYADILEKKPDQSKTAWLNKAVSYASTLQSLINKFTMTDSKGEYVINYSSDPSAMQQVLDQINSFNQKLGV